MLEGGHGALGAGWLWGKVAEMGTWISSEQLLGARSLFPFPHMWRRLADKLKGALIDDVFMEGFWGIEDYVDGWSLASVQFCQLMYGGKVGFRKGPARKTHWSALESIKARVKKIIDEWKPGLVWGPQQI